MAASLLHTPEGVRDIYDRECARKLAIQEKISHIFHLYGYEDIETPTFEYFDIFNKERGSVTSQEMFKFFDRDNNTLVLRPDMTPAIARCVGKYFFEETVPVRLCYRERTFTNNSSYQGRLKENTQLGGELIGDNSVEGDGEVLSLAIESLKAAGLKEFQLSVGHADFFLGLVEAAGLKEDEEEELRELISNKNYFGVDEMVSKWDMEESLRSLFRMLGGSYFSIEELAGARALAVNYPKVLSAVVRLEELHKVLEVYGVDKYVSYEPGLLSNYQYYTGIIFSGYTFGTGEPILKGGRYDKLLHHFGKDAPAIGFAVVVDQLMLALSRQKVQVEVSHTGEMIVYTKERLRDAILAAKKIRDNGGCVELFAIDSGKGREDYELYCEKNHIGNLTFLN